MTKSAIIYSFITKLILLSKYNKNFDQIQNENLKFAYKQYSKIIPFVGKLIVGQKEPYEYLIESIEKFVNQDELIELMKNNKFQKCNYENLSNGIVSIHTGWKI